MNTNRQLHILAFAVASVFIAMPKAHANFIARTTHGNFEIVKTGRTSELRPPQTALGNGNAVASTGTITQGMGATAGGSTAASGVNLGGTATVPVNGSNVAVAVKTSVGADVLIPAAVSALSCARGGVAGAVICGGTALALPFAMDWLANAGMRINPSTKQLEKQDPTLPQSGWYQAASPVQGPWAPTRTAACDAASDSFDAYARKTLGYKSGRAVYVLGEVCDTYTTPFSGSEFKNGWLTLRMFTCTPGTTGCDVPWLPASMDDIEPYMRKAPVNPGIVKELTDAGQNLGNPPLQVSGPSSVPGPTTTNITNNTTNNSTTTTTTNTTNNYTYSKNSVTNTGQTQTQTKTTTTTNADGTKTTTTETGTTTTPTDPDKADPQDERPVDSPLPGLPKLYEPKYPDGLEGVWRDQKANLKNTPLSQLTSQLMPQIGTGGSCPTMNINLSFAQWANFGTSNIAPPCEVWDWGRLIIIASALLLARALVFGG